LVTGGRPATVQAARDITADAKRFIAAIRTRVFTFLRAWSLGRHAAAAAALDALDGQDASGPEVERWPAARLKLELDAYRAEHDGPRLDPEARNIRHTYVDTSPDEGTWRIQQMLVDAEMHNDWVAEFVVDVAASRSADAAVLRLQRIGPLAAG
jgi:hypothetical protein